MAVMFPNVDPVVCWEGKFSTKSSWDGGKVGHLKSKVSFGEGEGKATAPR